MEFASGQVLNQVEIQGQAERLSAAESLRYFITRPRTSQLATWSSPQSRPIDSKKLMFWQGGGERLDDRFEYMPDGQGGRAVQRLAPWSLAYRRLGG